MNFKALCDAYLPELAKAFNLPFERQANDDEENEYHFVLDGIKMIFVENEIEDNDYKQLMGISVKKKLYSVIYFKFCPGGRWEPPSEEDVELCKNEILMEAIKKTITFHLSYQIGIVLENVSYKINPQPEEF